MTMKNTPPQGLMRVCVPLTVCHNPFPSPPFWLPLPSFRSPFHYAFRMTLPSWTVQQPTLHYDLIALFYDYSHRLFFLLFWPASSPSPILRPFFSSNPFPHPSTPYAPPFARVHSAPPRLTGRAEPPLSNNNHKAHAPRPSVYLSDPDPTKVDDDAATTAAATIRPYVLLMLPLAPDARPTAVHFVSFSRFPILFLLVQSTILRDMPRPPSTGALCHDVYGR